MERAGVVTRLATEEVLVVGGHAYVMHLPTQRRAQSKEPSSPGINDIGLTVRVTRDEEHVELWIEHPGGHLEVLPPRAHYYALLQLARIKLASERQPQLPELTRGWISVPDLFQWMHRRSSSGRGLDGGCGSACDRCTSRRCESPPVAGGRRAHLVLRA